MNGGEEQGAGLGWSARTGRRGALQAMALASAALWLGGCRSGPQRATSSLPLPVWPDEEPGWTPPPVVSGPPQPIVVDAPPPPPPPTPRGVIARARWNSSGPNLRAKQPAFRMNGINRITVHHDGLPPTSLRTQAQVARRLSQIRNGHLSNGWVDIGYHYAIDPMGNVWECRSVNLQGAHVKDNNEHNLGVLVLGNFDQQQPTSAAMATLQAFVPFQMRRYRVGVGRVYTHQELNPTRCPGRNLQRAMVQSRQRGGALASG